MRGWRLVASGVLLTGACSGGGGESPASPPAAVVARVTVTPASLDLSVGESAVLQAQGFTASGVVDQMSTIAKKAAGTDILVLLRMRTAFSPQHATTIRHAGVQNEKGHRTCALWPSEKFSFEN